MRTVIARIALATLLILPVNCTRVVVTRNPGYDDEGIRYYRPKPYLMLSPAATPNAQTTEGTYVAISVQYLPDYSEEYSIKLRSGIGQGRLSVSLEDGWNLTSVDLMTDQQVDELIGSFANLLSAAAPLAPERAPGPATAMAEVERPVPLGLYEAVIAEGPNCQRGIFAWRYVGFAPFNSCAVLPHNDVEALSCHDLWALVPNENGQLAFRRIAEIKGRAVYNGPPDGGSMIPPAPLQ